MLVLIHQSKQVTALIVMMPTICNANDITCCWYIKSYKCISKCLQCNPMDYFTSSNDQIKGYYAIPSTDLSISGYTFGYSLPYHKTYVVDCCKCLTIEHYSKTPRIHCVCEAITERHCVNM